MNTPLKKPDPKLAGVRRAARYMWWALVLFVTALLTSLRLYGHAWADIAQGLFVAGTIMLGYALVGCIIWLGIEASAD